MCLGLVSTEVKFGFLPVDRVVWVSLIHSVFVLNVKLIDRSELVGKTLCLLDRFYVGRLLKDNG